jgi:hypothetical protein
VSKAGPGHNGRVDLDPSVATLLFGLFSGVPWGILGATWRWKALSDRTLTDGARRDQAGTSLFTLLGGSVVVIIFGFHLGTNGPTLIPLGVGSFALAYGGLRLVTPSLLLTSPPAVQRRAGWALAWAGYAVVVAAALVDPRLADPGGAGAQIILKVLLALPPIALVASRYAQRARGYLLAITSWAAGGFVLAVFVFSLLGVANVAPPNIFDVIASPGWPVYFTGGATAAIGIRMLSRGAILPEDRAEIANLDQLA